MRASASVAPQSRGGRATGASAALVSALLLTLAGAGCASMGVGTGSSGERVDENRITQEELRTEPGVDLYTVVDNLRPRWLRARPMRTLSGTAGVAVIVDGIRQNYGADSLRSIRAEQVEELRYLSAADATTQYGTDMAGGAILVFMKR